MGKTAVVFSCAHVSPDVSNDRFNYLGEFLYDLKPDYVVDHLGGLPREVQVQERPQAVRPARWDLPH